MPDVLSGDIASYVQTIYENAELIARDNSFLTNLVLNFSDASGTAIRSRSEYGSVTFNQISDADDLTSQAFTPAVKNSLTPKYFGAQFFITDLRIANDPFQVRRDAESELGLAAAEKVQKDIISNFSSLTGGTVGSAGGTLRWADFFAALTQLKRQKAPMPWSCVLEPGQWHHLGTAVVPAGAQTNAPDFQDEVVRQWWVARVGGVNIFVTPDIASGTAAVAAMFSRNAIAFDLRRAFRIEPERDASRGGGGWELNATMLYATGVWRPSWGVQMIGTSVI